jgi:hypothetical protein
MMFTIAGAAVIAAVGGIFFLLVPREARPVPVLVISGARTEIAVGLCLAAGFALGIGLIAHGTLA